MLHKQGGGGAPDRRVECNNSKNHNHFLSTEPCGSDSYRTGGTGPNRPGGEVVSSLRFREREYERKTSRLAAHSCGSAGGLAEGSRESHVDTLETQHLCLRRGRGLRL